MTKSLEQRLRAEVAKILNVLEPVKSNRPPHPNIAFAKQLFPQYKQGTLHIPRELVMDTYEDKVYQLGKAAGLVLWHHHNPKMRPFFEKEQSQAYEFWSQLNTTFAGLVVVESQEGTRAAYQRAEYARNKARATKYPDENFAGAVGVDYGAQVYLKKGRAALPHVLRLHHLVDVHALVTPNEDFCAFVIHNTER